jgi:SusD family.
MKKYLTIIIAIGVLSGCSEDFLNRIPKDELSEVTTFSNYDGIKTYAWQFYSVFNGYHNPAVIYNDAEFHADLMTRGIKNYQSSWIWQKVVIPTNSDFYNSSYTNIRACNILLKNIDDSKISDVDKNHWRSVAYFFKAYNYAELINKFGDVTWVENDLPDDDQETLYGPRTPRNEVAAKILALLQYAEANIKTDGDGINTVNVHVVRALISRFGLREGTWRKYHGLSDADTYLKACTSASEKLLISFPGIMPNYGKVFNSESLQGEAGIILYKQYEENQITHQSSYMIGSSGGDRDLTRRAIDMYLMKDGQTRWTSPLFEGEEGADGYYKEFRNRDTRLYFTTPPPYKVIAPGTATTFTYTGVPQEREFIDLMNTLDPSGMQGLPLRAWCEYVVHVSPHFFDNNGGKSYNVTLTGYLLSKFWNRINENIKAKDINDAPIFRIEEVMLNYAEAQKELGGFNQTICNNTINKLRARGGVASLNLANIPNDPTRDPSVDPEMWEIRRERAVELMGEGFRFDDLRRWKKMDYATEQKLGRYIVAAQESNKVKVLNNAPAGYVCYEQIPPTPFPDYYYLYPIPSNQIVLTKGVVTQNPGWK